ncbi:hypothetical protein BC937DRAFT_93468 [Endogone sp. FLAS-F59071]|nr:hypothetical protein BC937DRAFT_93468 [Endogone sp. FLAS-F59071]|eukprot:RUS21148.1 hypothetical protein BC937DRAFT_93468 [Endogone sp. FLAS-F59071]
MQAVRLPNLHVCIHSLDTPDVLMNLRLHSAIRGCRRSSSFRLVFLDHRVSRVPKLYKLRYKHQAKILFREFESARIVLETVDSEPDNFSSLRNCLRLLLAGCLRATSLETVSSSRTALLPRRLGLDLILDDESTSFCPMPSLTWQAKKAGELALQQIRLAQLMRDPIQESKCWLYYAEDCIGVGMLRVAARIIRKQHAFAGRIHNETVRTQYGVNGGASEDVRVYKSKIGGSTGQIKQGNLELSWCQGY